MTSSSSSHCNVFLSFRGTDTRKNFISHLYQALVDRGITTFKDDETITIGKPFPQEILTAIQNSIFAIITISKNFASSMWCLIELQSIMKLQNRKQYVIVPIFYGVKPSDLRDEEGDFLKQLKEGNISSFVEEVPKWKAALKNVSTLQGCNPTNL
ncbi:Toll/interleukin-1 receptor-like protein [Cardamine amara subsp. amara]|uniref:Toll/interleukin-1 receptor-like protein n=1 Tax=Cardamine amara subsp. amara TaxID=228776 RepID=A0ABD0ZX74_CARAN